MLWLYWRRLRFPALVVFLCLAGLFVLAVGAGSMLGGDPHPTHATAAGSADVSGAQIRHSSTVPAQNPAAQRGLQLMSAATAACRNASYRGEQMVVWWGSNGATAYTIQVWHQAGKPEIAFGTNDVDLPSGTRTGAASHVTAGVLSMSARTLSLLRDNYLIQFAGTGSASGRSANLVVIRRRNGTLAARYWLDQATGLPLRREIFDGSGHLVNEGAFIDLHLGDAEVGEVPTPKAPAWQSQTTTAGLAGLRKQHWPIPSSLLGGMYLVALTHTATKAGVVVDASYSDGLSVVSVFLQRGRLPRKMPGWQRQVVKGDQVYVSTPGQRSVAWAAEGFVYTVIADAPPATVSRIVAGLPHDQHEGFWQRVGRGLKRIVTWADPFG